MTDVDDAVKPAEPGLRERKKRALRRRLVDTTLEVVRERGYEAATVEEIVRRVEVSQPTFYNYFPSKEAVLTEHAVRGWGPLLKELATRPGDVRTRLRRLFTAIARDVQKDGAVWRAIAQSGAYDPIRNPELLARADAGTRLLEAVIGQGQQDGELTRQVPAALMASALEGMMLRTVTEWAAHFPDARPLRKRMLEMFDFFLRGAAPTPDEALPGGLLP